MGNVAPPDAVVVREGHASPEHLVLGLHPQIAEAFGGQLSVAAAGGVDGLLEAVHGRLAENRGKGILYLLHKHGQPDLRILLRCHQALKNQHLPKHGGRFRRSEWGICLQQSLFAG